MNRPYFMDYSYFRIIFMLFFCILNAKSLLIASPPPNGRKNFTVYSESLPLLPEEGVFAYSRISSDGNRLSYASERMVNGEVKRTINIIDLKTRKILYSEPGMDSYWAPDGKRVIFLSTRDGDDMDVCIWHAETGKVARNVAPVELGAYFSWGVVNGKDLILTQENQYYNLENDKALRPYRTVSACPEIGAGSQPMISRDGRLIATFVRGTLVVRSLKGCNYLLETQLPGGKADFSYDGRYIAFHAPKDGGKSKGYEIIVVDLHMRTMIKVTDLEGSSYYPAWTKDGRLSFRHDSDKFRGFMMASGFLKNSAEPLPASHTPLRSDAPLSRLYPKGDLPAHRVVLVNFWAGWCVHCRNELPMLERLRGQLRSAGVDAEIVGVCEPSSFRSDRDAIVRRQKLTFPQLDVNAMDLVAFGVQVFPTSLMFVDGKLVERRYGAQSYDKFAEWFKQYGIMIPKPKS